MVGCLRILIDAEYKDAFFAPLLTLCVNIGRCIFMSQEVLDVGCSCLWFSLCSITRECACFFHEKWRSGRGMNTDVSRAGEGKETLICSIFIYGRKEQQLAHYGPPFKYAPPPPHNTRTCRSHFSPTAIHLSPPLLLSLSITWLSVQGR